MTEIVSNGSKWYGQAPDTIEELLKTLAEYPLDRRFEKYGNFIMPPAQAGKYIRRVRGKIEVEHFEGYPAGTVNFFGNFFTVSHVFNINTDDKDVIDKLTAAIRANQLRADYSEQTLEKQNGRQQSKVRN